MEHRAFGPVIVPRHRPAGRRAVLRAQGRLIDAVAGGDELCGTAGGLARRLGASIGTFESAVDELAAAGWITARARPDGRLTVRWGR